MAKKKHRIERKWHGTRIDPKDIREVAALYKLGLSNDNIGLHIGRSKGSIGRIITMARNAIKCKEILSDLEPLTILRTRKKE